MCELFRAHLWIFGFVFMCASPLHQLIVLSSSSSPPPPGRPSITNLPIESKRQRLWDFIITYHLWTVNMILSSCDCSLQHVKKAQCLFSQPRSSKWFEVWGYGTSVWAVHIWQITFQPNKLFSFRPNKQMLSFSPSQISYDMSRFLFNIFSNRFVPQAGFNPVQEKFDFGFILFCLFFFLYTCCRSREESTGTLTSYLLYLSCGRNSELFTINTIECYNQQKTRGKRLNIMDAGSHRIGGALVGFW